ncbi:hypothetical protein M9H77_10118 [Catharanthus roseus]|uniref:Uncharacterized protein n=1 Tax=Catharanthus roseus TaxID=4058 RepID=A0ACC0C347_CATRO|nr:hypothetical protein M9H77_10118 [Catharanthus roseus]
MEIIKRAVMGEVIPSIVMVAMEFFTIAFTILASTLISKGISTFVFVVYTNVLGSFFLAFFYFLFDRSNQTEEKPRGLTFHFYIRVFLLGLIGIAIAQNLAFLGLSYSSPIVACGMANLMPAFSFILSILLRRTKIEWKNSGSQVKLVGTLISIAGAASLTLYRGPIVKNSPFYLMSSSPKRQQNRLFVFSSTHENWILGCILYAAASLAVSAWNIIQVGTIKRYPQVMKIVCLYSFAGTILSAFLAIFIERDINSWKLELDMKLLVIVLMAIFGSVVRIKVNMWCTKLKGPMFVSIFKPVGIPIASMFGCFLFADTFHYGSMMGAVICGVGYYTIIWGQIAHDESAQRPKKSNGLPKSDEKVPLLEEKNQEEEEEEEEEDSPV